MSERTYEYPCGCRGYAEPREGEIGRHRLVIQVSPACRFDADKIGRKLIERKRALRMAIEALPDAWAQWMPSTALAICDEVVGALADGSIEAVENAVEVALAGLPDYVLCSQYPGSVGDAVRALMALKH
jgi:hypothetical protein